MIPLLRANKWMVSETFNNGPQTSLQTDQVTGVMTLKKPRINKGPNVKDTDNLIDSLLISE